MRRKIITGLQLVFCCALVCITIGSRSLGQSPSRRQEFTGSVIGIGGQFEYL